MAPIDPHSYTDSSHPLTEHVELALFVDFAVKTVLGSATLHLSHPHNGEFFLDTRGLHISSVFGPCKDPIPFSLYPPQPIKGSLLKVSLTHLSSFTVTFHTSPSSSALQWLDPPQTAGKTHPYVYTHCQPIHARSIFPCQDTPSVRIRYCAAINIPDHMNAVMSAAHIRRTSPRHRDPMGACDDALWTMEGRIVEEFNMEQCIPTYLFAMAAGDIAYADIGPRSRVYTEPSGLEAAANEFCKTESMVQQAEALFGPYKWERFDLLVLPPSFPYGGMENPRMVFLTPAVVVGDRSGAAVVAHELAHSWTGNLISNATNDDIWLNEGFTTYAERRIVEALEGEERACLHIGLGWCGLKEEMERFKDRPELTKLKTNHEGIDPDEVYSLVPYEKGSQFLLRLESEVGRPAFDEFLKEYISTFMFTSISTETFISFLKGHFVGIESKMNLDVWLYEPGIPHDCIEPKSSILQSVLKLAEGFGSGVILMDSDTSSWQAVEWQYYLQNLPKKLKAEQVAELDERFSLSEAHNWDTRVVFLTIAASLGYQPCFSAISRVLQSMGRMMYLRPLYSGLLQSSPEAKELAKQTYAQARLKYHPIAQSVVEGLFKKFDQ